MGNPNFLKICKFQLWHSINRAQSSGHLSSHLVDDEHTHRQTWWVSLYMGGRQEQTAYVQSYWGCNYYQLLSVACEQGESVMNQLYWLATLYNNSTMPVAPEKDSLGPSYWYTRLTGHIDSSHHRVNTSEKKLILLIFALIVVSQECVWSLQSHSGETGIVD